MVGSIEDKGIIPRVCEEMFVRIEKDETAAYQVEVSMVEIYNEKVRVNALINTHRFVTCLILRTR
jgi:hypothetical protein